jgi:hypothetical protein
LRYYHGISLEGLRKITKNLSIDSRCSCRSTSSTLKMEAACSSETSAILYQTTRRYIPEDKFSSSQFQISHSSSICWSWLRFSARISRSNSTSVTFDSKLNVLQVVNFRVMTWCSLVGVYKHFGTLRFLSAFRVEALRVGDLWGFGSLQERTAACITSPAFLPHIHPEAGGAVLLRNVAMHLQGYTLS